MRPRGQRPRISLTGEQARQAARQPLERREPLAIEHQRGKRRPEVGCELRVRRVSLPPGQRAPTRKDIAARRSREQERTDDQYRHHATARDHRHEQIVEPGVLSQNRLLASVYLGKVPLVVRTAPAFDSVLVLERRRTR